MSAYDKCAPERIWATEDAENFGEDRFHATTPMRGLTEYIRADLVTGWRCPRCNVIHAPTVARCECKEG